MRTYKQIPAVIRQVVRNVANAQRGSYRHDVIMGGQSWSGADLKGKARQYGARYAESRAAALADVGAALSARGWGARTDIVRVPDSKRSTRELVITSPSGLDYIW